MLKIEKRGDKYHVSGTVDCIEDGKVTEKGNQTVAFEKIESVTNGKLYRGQFLLYTPTKK